jgi:hypothetical protein
VEDSGEPRKSDLQKEMSFLGAKVELLMQVASDVLQAYVAMDDRIKALEKKLEDVDELVIQNGNDSKGGNGAGGAA